MPDYSFSERLKNAWNVFANRDPTDEWKNYGASYSTKPDRVRFSRGHEKSIISSIYNRIAVDTASIKIEHTQLDSDMRFSEIINSDLDTCFSLEANKDQTGRAFIQDVVMSMLDEGCVAIVPVDTTVNEYTGAYDIQSLRTGKITQWYPNHIRVNIYNDRTGLREEITLPKKMVAIIENPFYSIMNERNSTMQRLISKLSLLDSTDQANSSGKLDLLVQLPYTIKTEARRKQAEDRRKDIENQLANSQYGIAYIDGTEHTTQLNRPIENNLQPQIEYLTEQYYSQLGITQSILNGTADEKTLINYNNRTIEPIISAITDEMNRKFLTKTAKKNKQSILFFQDPFKLVPITELASIADTFTRNEILSSNEIRQIIGRKPSEDPEADKLRNKNLSAPKNNGPSKVQTDEGGEIQNE